MPKFNLGDIFKLFRKKTQEEKDKARQAEEDARDKAREAEDDARELAGEKEAARDESFKEWQRKNLLTTWDNPLRPTITVLPEYDKNPQQLYYKLLELYKTEKKYVPEQWQHLLAIITWCNFAFQHSPSYDNPLIESDMNKAMQKWHKIYTETGEIKKMFCELIVDVLQIDKTTNQYQLITPKQKQATKLIEKINTKFETLLKELRKEETMTNRYKPQSDVRRH